MASPDCRAAKVLTVVGTITISLVGVVLDNAAVAELELLMDEEKFSAADLYFARVLPDIGALIAMTIPFWQ